jgi:four helix bundle protein
MGSIQRFEDIQAWQKARILTVEIYRIFGKSRDYGFRDQIERASVSVMNNIAEGFERRGNREFGNYLSIAKGSCGEVRSMLCLAVDLNYIEKPEHQRLTELSIEISKMLAVFIQSLKKNDIR